MTDLLRRGILPLLAALLLAACPGPTPLEQPGQPPPPTDERPDPVPHPGEPFDEIPPVTGWVPYPEPVIDWDRLREPPPAPEPPEPEPPEPPPEPEPERPAPVPHPGEPFDEIPPVAGWGPVSEPVIAWSLVWPAPVPHPGPPLGEIELHVTRFEPVAEPVIDWGQFLLPPNEPHEPHEPHEPEEPEPEPDPDPETPGLPPEHIEETCTFEHVTRWNDVLQRVVIVSTRLRGPNEKACCIAMHAAQTQPRAEGKMCGCACDKETDACEQMTLQPPHHSNPDNRGGLVCALAGPFTASIVDDLFKVDGSGSV